MRPKFACVFRTTTAVVAQHSGHRQSGRGRHHASCCAGGHTLTTPFSLGPGQQCHFGHGRTSVSSSASASRSIRDRTALYHQPINPSTARSRAALGGPHSERGSVHHVVEMGAAKNVKLIGRHSKVRSVKGRFSDHSRWCDARVLSISSLPPELQSPDQDGSGGACPARSRVEWSAGRTDEAIRDAANICGGWPDWSDKNAALRDARFDLGACGVVKVFSALDVFVRCSSIRARSARVKALVVPEHQRFSTRSDRTRESPWTVSDVQW